MTYFHTLILQSPRTFLDKILSKSVKTISIRCHILDSHSSFARYFRNVRYFLLGRSSNLKTRFKLDIAAECMYILPDNINLMEIVAVPSSILSLLQIYYL